LSSSINFMISQVFALMSLRLRVLMSVGTVRIVKYSITSDGSQLLNIVWTGTRGFDAHSHLSNIKILEKPETVQLQQHNAV